MPISSILTVTILITILRWILRIAIIIFLADLLIGFVHWLEDSYGQENWPLIGESIIAPNLLHHSEPRAFLQNNWWQSADLQILGSIIIASIASLFGFLSWELILFLGLACMGNEVHKWAHRSKKENGRIITWLQNYHIIQGRKHHALHHGGDRNSHYCTLTQWVNPLLEKIKFWRILEKIIRIITGVNPRIDPAVLARRQRATNSR